MLVASQDYADSGGDGERIATGDFMLIHGGPALRVTVRATRSQGHKGNGRSSAREQLRSWIAED